MATRNVSVTLTPKGNGLDWKFESDGVVSNYVDKKSKGDVIYTLLTPGFSFCAPPTIDGNQDDQLSLPRYSYDGNTATVKDAYTDTDTTGGVLLHVENTLTHQTFTSPDPDIDNTGDHDPGN